MKLASVALREQRIVKLASDMVEDIQAKLWLFRDEQGTWERHAADLLEKSKDKAAELGMTEAAVDKEVATCLAYTAIQARILDVKKREKKRKQQEAHNIRRALGYRSARWGR